MVLLIYILLCIACPTIFIGIPVWLGAVCINKATTSYSFGSSTKTEPERHPNAIAYDKDAVNRYARHRPLLQSVRKNGMIYKFIIHGKFKKSVEITI